MSDGDYGSSYAHSSDGHPDETNPSKPSRKELEDEVLIIEYRLGLCDKPTGVRVEHRLESESHFAAIDRVVLYTLGLLDRFDVPDSDVSIIDRTLQRVQLARQVESSCVDHAATISTSRRVFPVRWIIAAVILGVIGLASLGIIPPLLRYIRQISMKNRCADNVWAIGTALFHYANGNNGHLPGIAANTDTWLCLSNDGCISNSKSLYLLIKTGCASPDVFQCPAAGGESFVPAVGMTDFPLPKNINYSYQYSINCSLSREMPGVHSLANQLAILADASPLLSDGTIRCECAKNGVSPNHRTGQNVLYLDGHVDWAIDCHAGVNGDNIWLVRGVEQYTGKEKPACITDSFLLPHPGW